MTLYFKIFLYICVAITKHKTIDYRLKNTSYGSERETLRSVSVLLPNSNPTAGLNIMGKYIDLTGKKFNYLFVIKRSYLKKTGAVVWECLCDCGKTTYQDTYRLKRGIVKSCGCYNKSSESKVNKKHGLYRHKLYGTYYHMRQRCYNFNDKRYKSYGGRGIAICDQWLSDFVSFYNWAIHNGYRDNLSIDRIDNDGDYAPENCRFVSLKKNNRNTSRIVLSKEKADQIRALYGAKKYNQPQLAKLFNTHNSTISLIINNKLWCDE